jgi:hypothetical protein
MLEIATDEDEDEVWRLPLLPLKREEPELLVVIPRGAEHLIGLKKTQSKTKSPVVTQIKNVSKNNNAKYIQ